MKNSKKLILPILTLMAVTLSSCSFLLNRDTVDGEIDSREINYNMGILDMPHTGNQKVLVVPIDFSDYPSSSLRGGTDGSLDNIRKLFFGDSESTCWESVSSFYDKSSYGKLSISGTVTPWFRATNRASDYSRNSATKNVTDNLSYQAVSWVKENTDISLDEYDCDNDGYIDAVWLVYSAPYVESSASGNADLWWAYTTWNSLNSQDRLEGGPKVVAYSWASYDFMFESGYSKPDAHTYIHETGHLLGLDDYYDVSSNRRSPLGGLAMMDCNIGDNDPFSKYLLGWTKPTVITEPGEYHLKPFESSGEFILIPLSYADNPYGEYIILQYYTPTGLNEFDAVKTYINGLRMYTRPGILMYHVDNRLGRFTYSRETGTYSSWNNTYYNDIDFYRTNSSLFKPVNSNSPYYSYANSTSQALLSLVAANDVSLYNAENRIGYADDRSLFQLGYSFVPNSLSHKGHCGTVIPYGFEVSELTTEEVVLTIQQNIKVLASNQNFFRLNLYSRRRMWILIIRRVKSILHQHVLRTDSDHNLGEQHDEVS